MSSYRLDHNGIQQIISEISDYLQNLGVDHKEITRFCLAMEEILLKYQKESGDDDNVCCKLSTRSRFGNIHIVLKIKGTPLNPNADISQDDFVYRTCLQNLDKFPAWTYTNGENKISLSFPKKQRSTLAQIIVAIISGILLGLILKSILPAEPIRSFCTSFLDPVNTAFISILSCTAMFFIFFSIVNGVCNTGSTATFNSLGRYMFIRITIIMLFITVALCLLSLLVFPVSFYGNGNFDLTGLWQVIVDLIPVNYIKAFLEGNILQVSILAIIIGIIILFLDERAKYAAAFMADMNNIFMKLLQWIIAFIPVSIFINVFELVMQDNTEKLLEIYKYPLFMTIFCLIFVAFFTTITCIVQHLPIRIFLRKVFPVTFLAFITASSSATISESYKVCEEKLGIDKRVINMGWPINSTFLGIGITVECIVGCLALAELFQVEVTVTMLISLGLNSFILSMATPKIPGMMVTVFTLLLSMLDVPMVALSLCISIQQIYTERINTFTSSMIVHTELIQQASKFHMIDQKVLREE